jgi:MGT family glycosyltransferase
MTHVGIICPNTPGHLNPMTALADALRTRGHRITFLLLGDPPATVLDAGFEVIEIGGAAFSANEYTAGFRQLGELSGRAALKHTLALMARATRALLEVSPSLVSDAGVTALLVDQTSLAGGTLADRLDLPFATVSNALLLNAEPGIPPFFSSWRPHDVWWARLRNRIGWAALDRLYAPTLRQIQENRRRHGLAVPARVADTWSSTLQISQQPEGFDFPRRELPPHLRFVGPLQLSGASATVGFPWDQLDGRPLIYASLGTLQNRTAGTFRTIAEACAGLDVQLVMSTGQGLAPEDLGELAGNPIVVVFAPQRELIRKAALAITHAGLNTVLEALSAGVPMVTVPITNDQPGIAARVAWTGAGEVLSPKNLTPGRLRALVTRVRKNKDYKDAAERMRQSIRTGGGAPRAAELIEQGLALQRGDASLNAAEPTGKEPPAVADILR